jgi:hypothetical protein
MWWANHQLIATHLLHAMIGFGWTYYFLHSPIISMIVSFKEKESGALIFLYPVLV